MLIASLTWIDVADTAVKIGLSAVVGAAGALFLARRTEQHDFDKEFFRRRQDMIERIATTFSGIHMLFFNICVDYSSLRDALLPGVPISGVTRERYYKHIRDIGENLREMHVLEGQLLVVSAIEATALLRRYRSHATNISDMLQLEHPTHTKAEIQIVLEQLCQLRDDFYGALATPFRRA